MTGRVSVGEGSDRYMKAVSEAAAQARLAAGCLDFVQAPDSLVGSTWQTWTDEGGDTGYSIEYGDKTVLVHGSAPAADLEEFVSPLER